MAENERTIEYTFVVEGRDPTTFVVIAFEAHEGVSEIGRVLVHAAVARAVKAADVMGKAATFTTTFGDGEAPRAFHGLVTRVGFFAGPAGRLSVEVLVEPPLAVLRLGQDNRIFPEDSVSGVIKKVLARAKLRPLAVTWSLKDEPPKRLHIFQRHESDWAFVERLLARDGINFVVRNRAEEQEVVFFDDCERLPSIEGDPTLWDKAFTAAGNDLVFDVREENAVTPDAVMMRAYDPLRPAADLDGKAPAKSGAHEIYLHPGDYDEQAVGKRLAQLHLQAAKLDQRVLAGRSNCPRLEPGRYVTLDGHAREALNGKVLLRRVIHRGSVSEDTRGRRVAYENHFLAAPEKTQLRPRPVANPPRGVSVAFVATPPGEEIHVDELGRIKVRFPWDRGDHKDDKSSGWLRVGQLALTGSMVLPRGGFEVLIDHELGDVDAPAIVGHLYNGKSPPPYALPDEATVSSLQTATTSGGAGANELRFDDTAGQEEIFINTSKDFTVSVDNDATFNAGKNETTKVGVNFERSVGTNHFNKVVANRSFSAGASQSVNVTGDYSETVKGNDEITIGAVRKVQSGGDHAETTTGQLQRTVAALQSVTGIKGVGRSVVGSSTVTAGAAWMEIVAKNRGSEVTGSRKETVAALKMIKAKSVSLSVSNGLTVNAAAEIAKTGGSRNDSSGGVLAVTTGAGLSAKAKSITIEAKKSLVMILGACLIRMSKSGKISVKAATVDLKGAKSLGQIKHTSN